jgi:hypothetical protein
MSLIAGKGSMVLEPGVSARGKAGASSFLATPGASFRFEMRANDLWAEANRGFVNIDSAFQREFIVERVNVDPLTRRPTGRASVTAKFKSGKKEELSFRVSELDQKTGRKTSAGRGRPVTVSLLTPGVGEVGSQTVTVLTNDHGVASAIFTAGSVAGSTGITATDDTSGAQWKGEIVVAVVKPGFWRLRNLVLMGAAAAITTIALTWGDGGPLRQEPPPQIP